jgi:hypothetical protein
MAYFVGCTRVCEGVSIYSPDRQTNEVARRDSEGDNTMVSSLEVPFQIKGK